MLTRMQVRDGRLVLPDGMSYRMLVLPQVETMTPQLLQRVRDLVLAGATVLGMPPWADVQESPTAVDEIVDIAVPSRVLAQLGVPPDFHASSNLRYIHKRLGETDVYFVANPEPRDVESLCTFRVRGKRPELWRPDTGHIQSVVSYQMKDGCTSVPLRFDPSGSAFVVFREAAVSNEQVTGRKNWPEFQPLQEIAGPWEVRFDPKCGGPADPVLFEKLDDWAERAEPGIRYYSGTATYRTTFALTSPVTRRSSVFLDLGDE